MCKYYHVHVYTVIYCSVVEVILVHYNSIAWPPGNPSICLRIDTRNVPQFIAKVFQTTCVVIYNGDYNIVHLLKPR